MHYQTCAYFHYNDSSLLYSVIKSEQNNYKYVQTHTSLLCYSLNLSCVDEIHSFRSVALPAWPKPVFLTMYIPQSEVQYKVTRVDMYIVM